MKNKILIILLIIKRSSSIYGEKLLLKKIPKQPKPKKLKNQKSKNLNYLEKVFYYEERTDSYKQELTKLMNFYDFKINLKKNSNFWFSFKNTLYCKSCDKNFRQTIFKDDHYLKNHLFFNSKKNKRFFLDLDSEIRRFSSTMKNRKFRNLICLDFFGKFKDFRKIGFEQQFEFCKKMIDVWDKHKLHVLYILFYYAFFYFAVLFLLIMFLVATIEYFDPVERKKYD